MVFLDSNQISLYGKLFRLYGLVRRTVATPFPPKYVVGDYTREDEIFKSTWVLSDFSGGIGVEYAQLPRDQDRYWFGDLETRYRHLTLAPQRVVVSDLAPVNLLVPYNELLYAVSGDDVYVWSETAGSFGNAIHSLSGEPVAADVFDGKLYILTRAGLHEYDYTTDTWVDDTDVKGYAMVQWDSKLFVLGLDNHIRWSITPMGGSMTWEDRGKLELPPGYCRQILIFFDQSAEAVIHAITRIGVYGYDFASSKFYPTPLTYPSTLSAGDGAAVWRGELYVPVGGMLYAYDGTTIRNTSPAKDDGLPEQLRGDIAQVIPGHAFFYCTINTVERTEPGEVNPSDIFQTTNPFDRDPMLATSSVGSLLTSAESSWHNLVTTQGGESMGPALAASIEGTYRLWITDSSGVSYIDLSTGLHNPLRNPTQKFNKSGYLETPWADLGWTELDKLAFVIELSCKQMSETEFIDVYVAWDDVDSWEWAGRVTESGSTVIPLAPEEGRLFKSIRLRFEMERGENALLTPVMHSAVMKFIRRPDMVWAASMTLQLTEDYEGRTPEELVAELYDIADNKLAGEFIYKDLKGSDHQTMVVLTEISGAELGGVDNSGRFNVSVVEVSDRNLPLRL